MSAENMFRLLDYRIALLTYFQSQPPRLVVSQSQPNLPNLEEEQEVFTNPLSPSSTSSSSQPSVISSSSSASASQRSIESSSSDGSSSQSQPPPIILTLRDDIAPGMARCFSGLVRTSDNQEFRRNMLNMINNVTEDEEIDEDYDEYESRLEEMIVNRFEKFQELAAKNRGGGSGGSSWSRDSSQ